LVHWCRITKLNFEDLITGNLRIRNHNIDRFAWSSCQHDECNLACGFPLGCDYFNLESKGSTTRLVWEISDDERISAWAFIGKWLVHLIYFNVNVAAITIIPQHDITHDPTASITKRRSPFDLDLGCALLYYVGCVET